MAWLVMTVALCVGAVQLWRKLVSARADEVAPPIVLPLGAADALIRAAMRRAGRFLVLELVAIAACYPVESIFFIVPTVAAAFGLERYLSALRVRRLLAQPRASAELRGTTLTACADGTHAATVVTLAQALHARESIVPRAAVV